MQHPRNRLQHISLGLLALLPLAWQPASADIANPVNIAPRIQLAILLDTSNSMDGLIDQTRNQLWQVVNEFSTASRDGVTPILEIALFEYGNDGIDAAEGHIRKRTGFTRELDRVSEGLFSLTTNGGNEFCGAAIRRAVDELQWSPSNADIKTIFIAGNEAFSQGPVPFSEAIAAARRQGISVNTIHAGAYQEGVDGGWQAGAALAGGNYMSIDANQQVAHVAAPQDAQIAELNQRLNQTYVPYGAAGATSAQRQQQQDLHSSSISGALLSKRAQAKASAYYDNTDWDLVDALQGGALSEDSVAAMEAEELPAEIREMDIEQKLDYLKQKADQRKDIQQRIEQLARAREQYVAEKKNEIAAAAPSVGDALSEAVKKEAARKQFLIGQ